MWPSMGHLSNYLEHHREPLSQAAVAYAAALDVVGATAPEVASAIVQELRDQRSHLKLIASENYSSLAVQLAMGNLLTDKYAEGVSGRRFYASCGNVDAVESLAVQLARQLFGSDHAYVQPHSGADANLVAYWAILVQKVQNRAVEQLGKKSLDELDPQQLEQVRQQLLNQKLLGLALDAGGHLTHGYRHNVSSKMMQALSYGVDPVTHLIDYDQVREIARRERPLILLAGYSSYPRLIDFARMRSIADEVGAVLMADMAHFAGLVAGKVLTGNYDPVAHAEIVTSTTHKTLRGPRGGLILCTQGWREAVDKGCPLVLGGPLPHVMAAKAVALREASQPSFQSYAQAIVANARALAERLMHHGVPVLTGGTDNHIVVADVRHFGLNGRQAEEALRQAGMTVNRNTVPNDPNGPWYTSGVRLGTPALTTRGFGPAEMQRVGDCIVELLRAAGPDPQHRARVVIEPSVVQRVSGQVQEMLSHFPLYPELAFL
jgi:glycine hydroxymethyltransferase